MTSCALLCVEGSPGASRQNLGLRFLAAELTQTGGEGQVSGTESQFRMHRIS